MDKDRSTSRDSLINPQDTVDDQQNLRRFLPLSALTSRQTEVVRPENPRPTSAAVAHPWPSSAPPNGPATAKPLEGPKEPPIKALRLAVGDPEESGESAEASGPSASGLGESAGYDQSFETSRVNPPSLGQQGRLNQAMTIYRPAVESIAEALAYETVFKKLSSAAGGPITTTNRKIASLFEAGKKLSFQNLAAVPGANFPGPRPSLPPASIPIPLPGLVPYGPYGFDQGNFTAKTDTPTYQPLIGYYKKYFQQKRQMGTGGFATVWQATDLLDGVDYAVKIIRFKSVAQFCDHFDRILREVRLLARLSHPHVIRYFSAWIEVEPSENTQKFIREANVFGMEERNAAPAINTSVGSLVANDSARFSSISSPPTSGPSPLRAAAPRAVVDELPSNSTVCPNELDMEESPRLATQSPEDSWAADYTDGSAALSEDSPALDQPLPPTFHLANPPHPPMLVNLRSNSESRLIHDPSSGRFDLPLMIHPTCSYPQPQTPQFPSSAQFRASSGSVEEFSTAAGKRGALLAMGASSAAILKRSTDSLSFLSSSSSSSASNDIPLPGSAVQLRKLHGNIGLGHAPSAPIPINAPKPPPGATRPAKETEPFAFSLFIKMQLCTGYTLKEWLVERTSVNVVQSMSIFKQIVEGLAYIHDSSVMHRDLKPSNIFQAQDGLFVLGDFGLAKAEVSEEGLDDSSTDSNSASASCSEPDDISTAITLPGRLTLSRSHTSGLGTASYAAPEQIEHTRVRKQYSNKVDIFPLGMILYELLVRFSAGMERVKHFEELRSGSIPSPFKDLFPIQAKWIERMTSHIPAERPSCNEILTSELFSRISSASAVDSIASVTVPKSLHSTHHGSAPPPATTLTAADLALLAKEELIQIILRQQAQLAVEEAQVKAKPTRLSSPAACPDLQPGPRSQTSLQTPEVLYI